LQSALTYFARALELDPQFAAAYAALARVNITVASYSKEPVRRSLEAARAAALKAIDLDPGLSDAHVALAEVSKTLEWNWRLAEATYRKAIALSPSCESAHRALGVLLAGLSRFQEGKAETDRACDLDPLCLTVNTGAAWVRYVAGEFDETIDRCQYTLDMDPGYAPARRLLGAAHVGAGHPDRAVAELEAGPGPDAAPPTLAWLAHAMAVAGRRKDANELVAKLDKIAGNSYVPAYHLAIAHTGLGDRDRAFALLAKACADREPLLINVGVDPRFEPLRGDRRYVDLMAQLGIPR
jgi:tetratricopeptide (TPR) repeat protein